MFKKILVADRGLIQANCIRAIKELGAQAVAIYEESDKEFAGVRNADEAHRLETRAGVLPYCDIDQIVGLAERLKVDAVHPGYGFMAQNTEFKNKLRERGITMISPQAEGVDLADKAVMKLKSEKGSCRKSLN